MDAKFTIEDDGTIVRNNQPAPVPYEGMSNNQAGEVTWERITEVLANGTLEDLISLRDDLLALKQKQNLNTGSKTF